MAASTLTKADFDQLMHLVRPLATRIANTAVRATVQLVDDTGKLQMLQIGTLGGETPPDAEHFQSYGFSSVPLVGAEGVVIFPNGDGSHPLVIVMSDRRSRPTGGAPGDVSVYNAAGAQITLLASGGIEAHPAPGSTIQLGGATAAQRGVLGDLQHSALDTLLAAISSAVGTSGSPAGATAAATAITTAIAAYNTASAAFLSAVVKLS